MNHTYWVDVRDVAKAHIEALQREEAVGKRFILAPWGTTYSNVSISILPPLDALLTCVDCRYRAEAFPSTEAVGGETRGEFPRPALLHVD
jgi:hypothetical protein